MKTITCDTKVQKKYSKEQLSRILSAHMKGQLIHFGQYWESDEFDDESYVDCAEGGCVNQVAYLEPNEFKAANRPTMVKRAGWFDDHYKETWAPEELLCQLELKGWA